jgi:hypothetical protein
MGALWITFTGVAKALKELKELKRNTELLGKSSGSRPLDAGKLRVHAGDGMAVVAEGETMRGDHAIPSSSLASWLPQLDMVLCYCRGVSVHQPHL